MAKDNRRAAKLWKRLVQSYGARFSDTYGEEPNELWATAIADLSDEQIAYGIRAVQRETPIHPPTLGQFVKACNEMPSPRASSDSGPSLQEQLTAYVVITRPSMDRAQRAAPWTFVYREWLDPEKPKYQQRCAECSGVLIPAVGPHEGFQVTVLDMLGNKSGHARALRSFKPGPPPTAIQSEVYRDGVRKSYEEMRS
jgi:hypothetical protein